MHFFDRSSFPVRVFCDIDEWQVGFTTSFSWYIVALDTVAVSMCMSPTLPVFEPLQLVSPASSLKGISASLVRQNDAPISSLGIDGSCAAVASQAHMGLIIDANKLRAYLCRTFSILLVSQCLLVL